MPADMIRLDSLSVFVVASPPSLLSLTSSCECVYFPLWVACVTQSLLLSCRVRGGGDCDGFLFIWTTRYTHTYRILHTLPGCSSDIAVLPNNIDADIVIYRLLCQHLSTPGLFPFIDALSPPPLSLPSSSAYDVVSREKVAVKKLSRPFQSLIHSRRSYRELRLLKHMKHENVSEDEITV